MPSVEHYIPQMLLRGFSSRRDKKQVYTFLFRRGGAPRETNVRNVGGEVGFYRSDAGNSVDATLTSLEGRRFDRILKELRTGAAPERLKADIDDFINHMIVRTKSLRVGFAGLADRAARGVLDEFSDTKTKAQLVDLMLQEARRDPQIETILGNFPQIHREQILRKMASEFFPIFYEQFRDALEAELPKANLSAVARGAQLKALDDPQTLGKRAGLIKSLQWRIQEFDRGTFVLGDIGPLAKGRSSMEADESIGVFWRKAILVEMPLFVCLPISSALLLVGHCVGSPLDLDFEEINRASVEQSSEFYVASQNTPREQALQSQIGIRGDLMECHKIRELVREGFQEALANPAALLHPPRKNP